jgi:conjugative relaxase-like TrwC/TraI family protein
MMTAASIPSTAAGGYADYLDSRTVAPEQGDYYLGHDGAPAEAPGRWLTDETALRRVGVTAGERVVTTDLRALMEGRAASSPHDEAVWLRGAGADGSRAAGIDATFSAPKSVSVAWAVGPAGLREQIEAAHHVAILRAVEHMRMNVPVVAERAGRAPAPPRAIHAASFLHTTARGVAGQVPDPQLHSHVVITSAERADGSVAAIRSRPVFRAARELGAVYRAHLADGMRTLGFGVEADGEDGRYFRLTGVKPEVDATFSKRTTEIRAAAVRFRAQHGRDPERGELRSLAVTTREAKTIATRGDLDAVWRRAAADHDVTPDVIRSLMTTETPVERETWRDRVMEAATAERAVFGEARIRTVAFEHAAGHGVLASEVADRVESLRVEGQLIELDDGLLTTARMRELETGLERRIADLSRDAFRDVSADARDRAIDHVQERLGQPLTAEQRSAIEVLIGPQRAAILVGQAGTGKGVVIDAAARAEIEAGREVFGVAVAGRTAQQLGEASPTLHERVATIDAFVNRVDRGQIDISARTTVYVDEAGMGDSERLARLTAVVADRGGCLVLIGDARQLPSVGAGGMFARLTEHAPTAELGEVMRTPDPAEQAAWRALRDGDSASAMAHYRDRGDLHFAHTRAGAVDAAARRYVDLARDHGHAEVALMTDASNYEVDALNLRVQHLRLEGGELSDHSVQLPDDGPAVREGDRLIWTRAQPVPGQARVENGVRGSVVRVDEDRAQVLVRLDGSDRHVTVTDAQLDAVTLGYASHVYRQQGATVDRAIAVTGGWQTSRESAYVEASRARGGVEWHVARDELDAEHDAARVDQLAARMRLSRAQVPSLAYPVREAGVDRAAVAIEPSVQPGVEIG